MIKAYITFTSHPRQRLSRGRDPKTTNDDLANQASKKAQEQEGTATTLMEGCNYVKVHLSADALT